MLKFSLVVATKGRTLELAQLLRSIDRQVYGAFEVIVIDQNDDERLDEIIKASNSRDKIRRVKCSPGLSRAKNVGLRMAVGDVVAFPDDDCWYQPRLLSDIAVYFAQYQMLDILSITSRDANGRLSGNRWPLSPCEITQLNVFRTSVSYSYFVRLPRLKRQIYFDEKLGLASGSGYEASEDTDFVIEAMKIGARARFDKTLYVGHPRKDVRKGNISPKRFYSYGVGMGYVQRKHGLLLLFVLFVGYDLVRAALAKAAGKAAWADLWYAHGRGLIAGYRGEPAKQ